MEWYFLVAIRKKNSGSGFHQIELQIGNIKLLYLWKIF